MAATLPVVPFLPNRDVQHPFQGPDLSSSPVPGKAAVGGWAAPSMEIPQRARAPAHTRCGFWTADSDSEVPQIELGGEEK